MILPEPFSLFITADGTPTLAERRADGYVEYMHHRLGALTETVFIYGHALDRAFDLLVEPRVLSIGLGIGYNELLTIAEATRRDRVVHVESYESNAFLRDTFRAWLEERPSVLAPVYETVVRRLGLDPGVAREWWRRGWLSLRGAFPGDRAVAGDRNLVFFDAYSNRMDAELWDEEWLVDSLGPSLAPTCVLVSYAATGTLKRALRRLNFTDQRRTGFRHKRQSTLAVRRAVANHQAASRSDVAASPTGSVSTEGR